MNRFQVVAQDGSANLGVCIGDAGVEDVDVDPQRYLERRIDTSELVGRDHTPVVWLTYQGGPPTWPRRRSFFRRLAAPRRLRSRGSVNAGVPEDGVSQRRRSRAAEIPTRASSLAARSFPV